MEIRALELENVKSYAHEAIAFAGGTNAICGPNGAGKSTILEALGYALFDHVPCRPIANLVREGEKTGTITVTLLADDEREYKVVRRCGGSSQYYVYDPELEGKIADGSKDVLAWLREQFGVEETADLSALFHDAVGVPQGLLTAAFLEKPSVRRAVFNPLLRVEEYIQAFDRLLDSRRTLDERAHSTETLIAGLRAEAAELPGLQMEAARLEGALTAGGARLAALAEALTALAAEKQALEASRDRLQQLTQEAGRLDERLAGLRARLEQARQAVEAAEAARCTLVENEAGHAAYLAAQEELRALEARREARGRLQQALAAGRAEAVLAAERLHRAEEALEAATAAEAEAERLLPKATAQAELEAALHKAEGEVRRLEVAGAGLERERARLQDLETRLATIAAGMEEAARLQAERGERRGRQEALAHDLQALAVAHAEQQVALAHLQAQTEALSHVEAAQCPVCEGELSVERQAELLRRNSVQAEGHHERLEELAAQEAQARAERDSLARELQALEKRLARLPRPAEREETEAQCDAQRALLAQAEAKVAQLVGASAQAVALAQELAALGDPRRAYERALDAAHGREALAQEVERAHAKAAASESRLAELQAQLAAYAGLDEALAAARDALAASESDHRRYLQHEREARALPERVAARDDLQAGLEEAQTARRQLDAGLAAATAAYRDEDYARVSLEHQRASDEESRLAATVDIQRGQLEQARARIGHLQEVEARLAEAEQALVGWRELASLLEYLRRLLKEAGPQVTRALVETISLEAAGLYSDITSDQISRLRWSEDYEVLLQHKAHERTFQQLSGGEQMAAALAVRLALLKEVSGIDIAFFDEPTSNLDDTRRENLAEQILGVGGFAQLFVVSHDDTFERATDHIVRIAKEEGASRVVS